LLEGKIASITSKSSGQRNVSVVNLQRIEKALDMSLAELVAEV
jgi:hypothetical protein